MQFREIVYEETESTNLVVKRAIEAGEPEGLVVRAWRQTAAYGRQGRTWVSPEGGLYFSVLLRPSVTPDQLPTLSLVAGLAVRDALASMVTSDQGKRLKVKWPNDLVVEEDALAGEPAPISKLAGISLEMHRGALCLGVGVNIEPPLSPVELAGKNRAAYLFDLGHGFVCDRRSGIEDVAQAVQAELAKAYERWCLNGFAPFVAEYDRWSYLDGRAIEIANVDGSSVASGVVRGIDERGCLLLEQKDGSVAAVASGEAHVKGLA